MANNKANSESVDFSKQDVRVASMTFDDGNNNVGFTPTHKVLTAAVTLTASQSGGTFYLATAGGFAVTLPSPTLGLTYTFVVSTAPTTAYTVTGGASKIKGLIVSNDLNAASDADFGTSGETTYTFVANKAVAGDTAVFVSDGTNWFVRGYCSVFDGATIS